MSAGASVDVSTCEQLQKLSTEDAANLCRSMDDGKYKGYADKLQEEEIDGAILASLKTEEEAFEVLTDLGVEKALHKKQLFRKLQKLGEESDSPATQIQPQPRENSLRDIIERGEVLRTPREMMSSMFAIQGIPCDPSDIQSCGSKIEQKIKSFPPDDNDADTDGAQEIKNNEFDVFISYRVSADKGVAELIYLFLKSVGLRVFLDKYCLKSGEDWKVGFINGITSSRFIVSIMSRKALELVRNDRIDHFRDNVLLEYDIALRLNDRSKRCLNMECIIPVHLGFVEGSTLTKFCDFSPSLYAESLRAQIPIGERLAEGQTIQQIKEVTPLFCETIII